MIHRSMRWVKTSPGERNTTVYTTCLGYNFVSYCERNYCFLAVQSRSDLLSSSLVRATPLLISYKTASVHHSAFDFCHITIIYTAASCQNWIAQHIAGAPLPLGCVDFSPISYIYPFSIDPFHISSGSDARVEKGWSTRS